MIMNATSLIWILSMPRLCRVGVSGVISTRVLSLGWDRCSVIFLEVRLLSLLVSRLIGLFHFISLAWTGIKAVISIENNWPESAPFCLTCKGATKPILCDWHTSSVRFFDTPHFYSSECLCSMVYFRLAIANYLVRTEHLDEAARSDACFFTYLPEFELILDCDFVHAPAHWNLFLILRSEWLKTHLVL